MTATTAVCHRLRHHDAAATTAATRLPQEMGEVRSSSCAVRCRGRQPCEQRARALRAHVCMWCVSGRRNASRHVRQQLCWRRAGTHAANTSCQPASHMLLLLVGGWLVLLVVTLSCLTTCVTRVPLSAADSLVRTPLRTRHLRRWVGPPTCAPPGLPPLTHPCHLTPPLARVSFPVPQLLLQHAAHS